MRSIPTLLLTATVGCAVSHGTEPSTEQRPVIEVPGSLLPQMPFEVPSVVSAGASFTISYATYGSSSCSRHLAPTVTRLADELRITPRLAPIAPGQACTDDLATNRHSVSTSWPAPTLALQVVLQGYRTDGTPVEHRRTIRVI
jgi:hypothetical protein